MHLTEPRPLSFHHLTTGGQLVVWAARCWAAGGERTCLVCEAFVRAGLGEAVAPFLGFLEIVAVAAERPCRLAPVEAVSLEEDEITLVDALSALQRGRYRLGRDVLAILMPLPATRMALEPGLRLARALGSRRSWIGFRTDRPVPVPTPPPRPRHVGRGPLAPVRRPPWTDCTRSPTTSISTRRPPTPATGRPAGA